VAKHPLALPERPNLGELFRRFISDEVAGGIASEDTAATYRREAEYFWNWCVERRLDPLSVTRHEVVAYRAYLLQRYARASVLLKLSAVRRFYEAAEARGHVAENPAAGVRGPAARKTGVEYFSEAELDRIFRAVPRHAEQGRRDAAILGLMGLQGLRVVEVVRLDVEDLFTIDGMPHLRVTGKGGHVDLLPILPNLRHRILDYWRARTEPVRPNDPMFASTRNTGRG